MDIDAVILFVCGILLIVLELYPNWFEKEKDNE